MLAARGGGELFSISFSPIVRRDGIRQGKHALHEQHMHRWLEENCP
jgi:hypothetical protein